MDMDLSLKVIVVGNGQVGKTSMLTRFAHGQMTVNYKKTIGTDFMEKEMICGNGEPIKLMLWDTAGQEEFSTLTRQYYKGSGAVIYVYSTIDRASFQDIHKWKDRVTEECGDDIVSVLVQNKIDLLDQSQINQAESEELANKMSIPLFRVCVKNNTMVDDVFEHIVKSFLAKGPEGALNSEPVATISSIGNAHNRDRPQRRQAANTKKKIPQRISLTPSVVRTNGKKRPNFCNIL